MQHEITDKTKNFIWQWEDFKTHAYWDATGKVWTCGIGHTKAVTKDTVCTKEQAKKWLEQDCKPIAKFLNSLDLNITQTQFDALMSFAFNVGLGNLKKSTLLVKVKHSAPTNIVMNEFYKWKKSGGNVLAGLVLRREGEAMLYESGKYATKYDAQVHIEKRLGKDWRKQLGC